VKAKDAAYKTESGFLPNIYRGVYVTPGIYFLKAPNVHWDPMPDMDLFPERSDIDTMFLSHKPIASVTADKSFMISANIAGLDTGRASLQISLLRADKSTNEIRIIPFTRKMSSEFVAIVPEDMVVPGFLNYRIVLKKGNEFAVFPGNHKEDPFASSIYDNQTYQTLVFPENGTLEIFNPSFDKTATIYPSFRRGFQGAYVSNMEFHSLRSFLQLSATELSGDHTMGFVYYFGDKWKGRIAELGSFDSLVIRARALQTHPLRAKITLIDKNAFAFSTFVTVTNQFQDIKVPLNSFTPDSALLLPRPYPGFLPLRFKASGTSLFNLAEMEKIQITIGSELKETEFKKPYSMEVWSIWLERNKF
jgi:hypothetical protein